MIKTSAQVIGGGALLEEQKRSMEAQRQGGAYQEPSQVDRVKDVEDERQKNLITSLLTTMAGQQTGRGVPAYNQNMANGREGLVDPQLTQQQTFRPMPWDDRYASTANLLGIQNSNRLFAPSEQITKQVGSLTPQQQQALRPMKTIYEQTSPNWVQNRLNLALQRNREQSLYALK